ncbi:PLP-dependent transferase [Piedraia hortae CBS 480.64]|uniref:aromatic-amino-acid transaminase n=1 Tax=Piedraia hortae CBS 480.64 TaxID=1314780 RepID=A0A6A7BVL0_9PEZI|nr:PLP-dependent transferase [Piedraia hortae CBS 480.64]
MPPAVDSRPANGDHVPPRLTVDTVAKRRAAAGYIKYGAAAVAHVELYKGRTSHLHKPLARRWDDRLTPEAASRMGSSLKEAARYLKVPGLVSLGGGLPSPEYFPIEEISCVVPSFGDKGGEATRLTATKQDVILDQSMLDVATALQYGQGHGAAPLLRWIVEHTEIIHNPPYQDWSCTMTVGSTSAWDMALRMFARPGQRILTEHFTFPSAAQTAAPMGALMKGVPVDEYGLRADELDELLSNWPEGEGPKPFLLYTVPTGQNPTGSTQTLERRKAVYAVAQKHDLFIVEDEPYYFLQMQPVGQENAIPKTHEEFLDSLVPSYLSLDVDGRVMRMDSFSKVIAPGSRVGWITASEQICQRYMRHADLSTQGPSGASQLLLYKLLDEHWGHSGYLDWLMHIRKEYTGRRGAILNACEQSLPKDYVSWIVPMAGMFLWLRVDATKHPLRALGTEAMEDDIFEKAIGHGTLLIKGSWFLAVPGTGLGKDIHFRATFASAPFNLIEEAIRRFGDAVRDSFKSQP